MKNTNIPDFLNDPLEQTVEAFNNASSPKIEKWLKKNIIYIAITDGFIEYRAKEKT